MDKITGQIADFASSLTFADLTGDVVDAATQRLVDAIGCALGAHDCEPAGIGRRLAAGGSPGKYAGRTLFADHLLPVEAASFINSTMIRNLDFNDRYPGGHPSDCLGAHLALAGARAVDGKRFLAAMTVSYEIFARLSDGARLSRNGWDQGHAAGIATAAGVCNLLGVAPDATANAIGIAGASIVPLRVTRSGELTQWKNVATSYAVRDGLFAALLAAEGMVGPGNSFDGRDGLFDNITGPFELAPFPNAGGTFLMPRVLLKFWPIETNGQPVVWAALELREKITPAEIEEIEVFTDKFTRFEIGSEPEKWDPQNRETADHSLPYIFARTLVDGPLTLASFELDAVRDPALRPLMAKIKVIVDDDIEALMPETTKVRVVAKTAGGATQSAEVVNPLGHPDNPMQDSHIDEKFHAMGDGVLGTERCSTALAAWRGVRDADDLRSLMALLEL
jgi:2-methylcitrate dehydratase